MGISITSKDCTFKPTLLDLSSKANKATYSLLSKIPIKLTPVKTMLKLFDSCIASILLGVNRSKTNILIRSELGRHSLQEQILARNINDIKYIESKDPQTVSQLRNSFH